jgi:predicted NACHT family NTPase
VTGLTLYRFVVEEWLLRDGGKHHLTPEHKQRLMEHVAAELARSGARNWTAAELEEWLVQFVAARLAAHYEGVSREVLKEDLRTATFLVRDEEEDRFRFAHTSLQEYFLAGYLRRALERGEADGWELKGVSRETLGFLGQSLAEQPSAEALRGLETMRDEYRRGASELAFRYVLLAAMRGYPAPAAAGFQLPGADLWELEVDFPGPGLLELGGLNLKGARLGNTFWRRCRMAGSDLSGADAERAEWEECDLTGTRWNGAEVVGGMFRKCRLEGAEMEGARTRRVTWVKCTPGREVRRGDGELELQVGHSGWVNGCDWSRDGRWIVTASKDRTLKIWDADSGRCTQTLSGHSDTVNGCAWSPDGRRVLSASRDTTLRIWNTGSGRCLRTLTGHSEAVNGCEWSPDGRQIVSASWDTTLRIWDADTGKCLRSLSGHSLRVNGCAWSPERRQILSASADGKAARWVSA